MLIISDSSIFINFAYMDAFTALCKMFQQIVIPQKVYSEVYAGGRYIPGSRDIFVAKHQGWIQVVGYTDTKLYNSLPKYIHEGEREAITLFIEKKGDVLLMDDKAARGVAKSRITWDFRLINSFEICEAMYLKGIVKFNQIEMAMKLNQANFKCKT